MSAHRVFAVRVAGGAPAETRYALAARDGAAGARARLDGWTPRGAREGTAAERVYAALDGALPPCRRGSLEVEAGVVEQRTGPGRAVRRRRYLLAVAGGRLVHLAPAARPAPASPWSGELHANSLSPDLPVLLGPSAVLALVELLLEAGEPVPPPLRAVRGTGSPYPPHDAASGPDAGDSPFPELMARPDLWGTPFGALPVDELGTLAIAGPAPAAPPDAAVVVDSLLPLTGDVRSGAWEASLTAVLGGVAMAVFPAEVVLRIDPAGLLASVEGTSGAPEPALRREPFRGDRFGTAPPLATRTRLGALRGDGR